MDFRKKLRVKPDLICVDTHWNQMYQSQARTICLGPPEWDCAKNENPHKSCTKQVSYTLPDKTQIVVERKRDFSK